jgi:hypothetical protein
MIEQGWFRFQLRKGEFMRFRLLVAAWALACAIACFGQGTTGTITGAVTDPAGAVIVGAKITAHNAGTGIDAITKTNETGTYTLSNLSPAEYSIIVESEGFRRATLSPQRLVVGGVNREDVQLEVGSVSETVTIEAKTSQVNVIDAQMGRAIVDIPQLPILSGAGGRNPLALALTIPGVVTGAPGQVGNFSVNGARSQANNFMLDGGDSNDLAINIADAVNLISPNALSEFRLVTGSMKAEFGRNPGATVEVTTKSGTNSYHGLASEVFRNTALNATPFFQNAVPNGTADLLSSGQKRRPQWNTNDFDANFGGHIIKDKTFFFVSYLGFRRRQGVLSSAVVPTDAQRAPINANATPQAKALLALIPAANSGNTLFSSPSNVLDRDQGVLRLDHYFTQTNQLSVTYFIEDERAINPFAFGGSGIPGFGTSDPARFYNVVLRDAQTFSPTLFNEVRASYHRRDSPSVVPLNRTSLSSLGLGAIIPDDPGASGPPYVSISGFGTWGNTIQGPQSRADNTWQYADNLSWSHGRHTVKAGVDYRAFEQNQVFDFINNGIIVIDGSGVQNGLAKPIAGLPDTLSDFAGGFATQFVQNSAGRRGYRTKATDLFVQDDWKVSRNFTINVGLRWEYNTPLTDLANRVNTLRAGQQSAIFPDAPKGLVFPGDQGVPAATYKSDWNNFGPRAGIAWDVLGNGKLAIRAGYGVFFDTPISELTLQFLTSPPFAIQPGTLFTSYANPWAGSMINPIPQPFPFTPVKPGQKFDFANIAPFPLTVMDPSFATPYSNNWNAQVQYQVSADWVFQIGYVGNNGVKLLSRREINPAIPGPGATTGNTDARRILNLNNPLDAAFGGAVFSGITDQTTDAHSNFNSFQVDVTKRLSKGFSMTHAYTWSHGIDNASGLRVNTNIYDARLDRANSDTDARHRYVGTYIYEIPFMKGRQGFMGHLLGGWGISGITSYQTGLPFNITEPNDRCLCGGGNQRPDYAGGNVVFYDPRSNTAVSGRGNSYFDGTGGGSATGAPNPFFRRVGSGQTFAAGAGRYGNLGRNVFHGPGIDNWDTSAFKRFTISEHQNVEFRGEFFNIFNHTQFANPNGSIGSANFGKVTAIQGNPRIVQFTLRYQF